MKKATFAFMLIITMGMAAQTWASGEKNSAADAHSTSNNQPTQTDSQDAAKLAKPGDGGSKEGEEQGKEVHDSQTPHDAHPNCPVCPARSPAEFNVLMTLKERSAEIEERDALVQRRERALAELEKTIDGTLKNLESKVASLEKRLDIGEPGRLEKEKRIKTLVDTLSGLTAKKASPILAETDSAAAAEILRRMEPGKVAALLSILPASKAGEFVTLGVGKKVDDGRDKSATANPDNAEATP